jgi:chloramphenicol 3-O-phosphotransferase
VSEGRIVMLTGVMASGKSTVAQALAESTPKSVHLRGDVFRRMIVNNKVDMTPDAAEEAMGQLLMRYSMAAMTAREYADYGFTVFYQDVIVGPVLLEVLGEYDGYALELVVLCPRKEAVAAREAERGKSGYGAFSIDAMDDLLREQTPDVGHWIDSSDQTVSETVAAIQALLN